MCSGLTSINKKLNVYHEHIAKILENGDIKFLFTNPKVLVALVETKTTKKKKLIQCIVSFTDEYFLMEVPKKFQFGIANLWALEAINYLKLTSLIFPYEELVLDLLCIYDTAKKAQRFALFTIPLPVEKEYPLTPISTQSVDYNIEQMISYIIDTLEKNNNTIKLTKEKLLDPKYLYNFLYEIPQENVLKLENLADFDYKEILESSIGRLAQVVHFFRDEDNYDLRFTNGKTLEDNYTVNVQSNLNFLSGIRYCLKKAPELEKKVLNSSIVQIVTEIEDTLTKTESVEEVIEPIDIEKQALKIIIQQILNKKSISKKSISSISREIYANIEEFYFALEILKALEASNFNIEKFQKINVDRLKDNAKKIIVTSEVKNFKRQIQSLDYSSLNLKWKKIVKLWDETKNISVISLPFQEKSTEVEIKLPMIRATSKPTIKYTLSKSEDERTLNVSAVEYDSEDIDENKTDNSHKILNEFIFEDNRNQVELFEKNKDDFNLFKNEKAQHLLYFINKSDDRWILGANENEMFLTNSDTDFKVEHYQKIIWSEIHQILSKDIPIVCWNTTAYEAKILLNVQRFIALIESKEYLQSTIDILPEKSLSIGFISDLDFFTKFNYFYFGLRDSIKAIIDSTNKYYSDILLHMFDLLKENNTDKTIFNTIIATKTLRYHDLIYIILDITNEWKSKKLMNQKIKNKSKKSDTKDLHSILRDENVNEMWKICASSLYWAEAKGYLEAIEEINKREIFFNNNLKNKYKEQLEISKNNYHKFEYETLEELSKLDIEEEDEEKIVLKLFPHLSRIIVINIIRRYRKNIALQYEKQELGDDNDEDFFYSLTRRSTAFLLKNVKLKISRDTLKKVRENLKLYAQLLLNFTETETWLQTPKDLFVPDYVAKEMIRISEKLKNDAQIKEKEITRSPDEDVQAETEDEFELFINKFMELTEKANSEVSILMKDLSEEEIYKKVFNRLLLKAHEIYQKLLQNNKENDNNVKEENS